MDTGVGGVAPRRGLGWTPTWAAAAPQLGHRGKRRLQEIVQRGS